MAVPALPAFTPRMPPVRAGAGVDVLALLCGRDCPVLLVGTSPLGVERLGGDGGGGDKAECEGEVVHGNVLVWEEVEVKVCGSDLAGGRDDAVQEAVGGGGYLYRAGQAHAGEWRRGWWSGG